jgi:hypothetical protein
VLIGHFIRLANSGKRWVACGLALLLATITCAAVALDGGVDPANLGKGDWIYFIDHATNHLGGNVPGVHDIPSLMEWEKKSGMDFLVVKAGTGATNFNGNHKFPQFDSNLVFQAHTAGLKIFGYTRSLGLDVPGEIELAGRVYGAGADGFVIDAEAEWESNNRWIGTNGPALAWQLGAGIKSNWPSKLLAHAPMPVIGNHPSFPYKEFGLFCDAVMPQAYWQYFKKTPADTVQWMDAEWRNFHASLSGIYTNAIKPLAPVGQADTNRITAAQINQFFHALKTDTNSVNPGGYLGCSFWRADLHTAAVWYAIAANTIGAPPPPPPPKISTDLASWVGLMSVGDTNGPIKFVAPGTNGADGIAPEKSGPAQPGAN